MKTKCPGDFFSNPLSHYMRTIFLLSISMFLTFTGCGSPDDGGGHNPEPEMYNDHESEQLIYDDSETDSQMHNDHETDENKIFETFCCSNHNVSHCGKRAELPNLIKTHGCNGFH